MSGSPVLDQFSPAVRAWFETSFPEPTPPQAKGWPTIASGAHTLILAPTGSGKTLSAFLWAIDRLTSTPPPEERTHRTRVIYLSPLRALAVDVEKNLRAPIQGIRLAAERLGVPYHEPTVGMRTGDTPADERRKLVRNPPDILITTPESLYLMLTSQARETLQGVEAVIVDEIHAVAKTKRGSHLSVTMERLVEVTDRPEGPQRIGLSATQRPLEEIAEFLGGRDDAGSRRRVDIVDAGVRKELDIEVIVPVEDMGDLGKVIEEPISGPASLGPVRRSIWPSMHPRLLELVQEHRSTLIFVNARRLAERLATRLNELAHDGENMGNEAMGVGHVDDDSDVPELVKAHHGSISPRAPAPDRGRAQVRSAEGPGGHVVARARHRHGRRRPRGAGRVTRQRVVGAAAHRARRPPGGRAEPGQAVPQAPRRPGRGRGRGEADAGRAHRAHPLPPQPPRRAVPADRRHVRAGRVAGRRPGPDPAAQRQLRRPSATRCSTPASTCSPGATRPRSSASCARASSGTAPPGRRWRRRAWPGRRAAARRHQPRHHPRPRPVRRVPPRRHAGRRARRGDGVRVAGGRDVPARRVDVAHRGDHLRAGHRHAGARPARQDAVLARRGAGPAARARPGHRPVRAGAARPQHHARPAQDPPRATTASTSSPPSTWCPTSTSRPRPPASSPTTAPSSSSASATRSATGGSASCRRSAPRCTPRGPWRCSRRSASGGASTSR